MSDRKLTTVELAKLRGPKQWKEHDAERVLAAWKGSGLSVNAFAREQGLGRKRILWWRQRLAAWRRDPKTPQSLIPVVPIAPPEDLRAHAQVVIRVPGGIVVEVADTSTVKAEWTSRVANGLARKR